MAQIYLEDVASMNGYFQQHYQYPKKTLVLKTNSLGIKGIFTENPIARNETILSVDLTKGALRLLQAHEESLELLKQLGEDRHGLQNNFVLATALYLRQTGEITESGLQAIYSESFDDQQDSLASIAGTPEAIRLLYPNKKSMLDNALLNQKYIEKMGVNQQIFQSAYGYILSRSWAKHGVLPVFDWYNAAYGSNTNMYFTDAKGKAAYIANRDIAPGEELVWKYNNNHILYTYSNYGYIDRNRPLPTSLMIALSPASRDKLSHFFRHQMGWSDFEKMMSDNIDPNALFLDLYTPGSTIQVQADKKYASNLCKQMFAQSRLIFRSLLLSEGDVENRKPVAIEDLNSDALTFGGEFEAQVIEQMQLALKQGHEQYQNRMQTFRESQYGARFDTTEIAELIETGYKDWSELLDNLSSLCRAVDVSACLALLQDKMPELKEKREAADIKLALEQINQENPTLKSTLFLNYLSAKLELL